MRIKNLFVFLFIITSGISNGREVQNIIEYKMLNDLLDRKEYFKLNNELIRNESKLTEDRKLYYKVFVDVAFGEREIANQSITTIFQKYRNSLNDTTVLKLLDIQASNYLYLYQYKKATNVYEYILTNHAELLDSSGVKNYMNVKNLFGTFANTAPQKMSKQKDVLLNSHRNNFNHLMTPVRIGATNEDFIFDTGANLSTISESQAKKMKLRVFEQSVDIGSSTQRKVQSKLAYLEAL